MILSARQVSPERLQSSMSATRREMSSPAMDYPPLPFMDEPVPDGPNKGHCIRKKEMDHLLDEYYAARGWDTNGIPLPETLRKTGLT